MGLGIFLRWFMQRATSAQRAYLLKFCERQRRDFGGESLLPIPTNANHFKEPT